MDAATLCTVAVALTVLPNRSQFFMYESMTLTCGQLGNSSDWRVMMNTSPNATRECRGSGNETDKSSCFIDHVLQLDAGVYWCESEAGVRGDIINISVADGDVILGAPVHPVAEGDDVTLRCERPTPSSNLTARFYRDDLFVLSSASGNMTMRDVSKSHEGRYRCVLGDEESPDSWLTVTVQHRERPHSHLLRILLPVTGACLWLVLSVLCFYRCLKGKRDSDLSYTDVVIAQGHKPPRIKETRRISGEFPLSFLTDLSDHKHVSPFVSTSRLCCCRRRVNTLSSPQT
ncbi:low affinity immunoglobulin gamma Fc region receptor II-like [Solea solea]|uniref:low affinity immunoglobulin gamma Fc region receptor II-like n=1 Tax=Solea solea TaxID=90069 RepID=UPI0027297FC3|nr:low affinity immunoglobulin gamma Fc region receptor II-like [Solea solea]